jgi:putative endonuclease
MIDRRKIGSKGEDSAVEFLFANGYQVLQRNYRFSRAEIDVIARKEGKLVFVEVKTRKSARFGYPETFLSDLQKERIHRAAEAYIVDQAWQGDIRFDIIAILWAGDELSLEHFEDAF